MLSRTFAGYIKVSFHMNRPRPSLRIEIVWLDSDMLELRLSVCNADFAGQSNFYAALDEPKAFAKAIEGFPDSVGDVRAYEFGDTRLPGYGGAKVKLYCRDGTGHLVVRVVVHQNPTGLETVPELATVRIDVVPAAIDSFVEELRRMKTQVGESATLQSEN